jgi:hypothetical protein
MGPQATSVPIPDVDRVRATVEEHFPGLWLAVDAALSVCATLLLKGNRNPTALVFMGGPSGSKTTVVDMFADETTTVQDDGAEHPLFYHTDNFTPAAFVSQAANRTAKDLEKVDLLPRLKHKVLVTPELAPTFRGDDDELVKMFKIVTRVLDGRGLMLDGGVHGRRGYRGDYLFAWIGATTPFEAPVWRVMGQLGSRLFFVVVPDDEEVTVEMLVKSDEDGDYGERLDVCRQAIQLFLGELFKRHEGIRGVTWDESKDPETIKRWIAQCGVALAAMRSEPTREADPEAESHGYVPPKREKPWRAHTVLRNLARGHAIVHGRNQLTNDDLPLVARIAVDSMPSALSRVFKAIVANGETPLTVSEAQNTLGAKHPATARKVLEELERRGVGDLKKQGDGKPALLVLRPEWAWCICAEFRSYLLGESLTGAMDEPVNCQGVCASPITPNLAEHLTEREEEREEESRDSSAHTPQEMTGSTHA